MTQEQVFEIARTFFGQTLRVDARHARLSIKSASVNFHRAVVAIDYGPRHFEVEINRPGNTIRLIEVTTHRKFGYDHRNPLNGFTLKDVRSERVLRTHRLEGYLNHDERR
ncbi:hypothetical protein LJC45_01595 [Alistipes sp. OttesenSCG-928-B03]|nr:hypothetical protein [Alistipes sp. OttesenSCG-928-B03]